MQDAPFGKKANSSATRKYPRFQAKPLHSVSFYREGSEIQIKIANISNGGLGLFAKGIGSELPTEFYGTLTIGKDKFKVQIKKVFDGEEIIGCQFIQEDPKLRACIDLYFQTEILALKLSRVETKPGRGNTQDKIIFFHGQNNCELLINERNSQICYFSVIVLGNSIEVDPKKSISSGVKFDAKGTKHGVFLFKPQQTSPYIIENAIRFIDNIQDLTLEYRQNLIRLLNETSNLPLAGSK